MRSTEASLALGGSGPMTLGQHFNPLHTRRLAISTTHLVSECVERLRADLAPWWAFFAVRQTLQGRVSETGFALRRHTGARQSLPSQARGRFAPDGHGTRLEVTIGWRRLDLVGLSIAVVCLIALGLIPDGQGAPPAWLPWVLALAVVAAVVLHRLATLHDDDWLVAHLCELLDGTVEPEPC